MNKQKEARRVGRLIHRLKRLRLAPGEVLLVQVPLKYCTECNRERITRGLRQVLPGGRVFICPVEWKFSVISDGQAPAMPEPPAADSLNP